MTLPSLSYQGTQEGEVAARLVREFNDGTARKDEAAWMREAVQVIARPLTAVMLRELRTIHRTGEVGDLLDYGSNALAFYSREKTIAALLRRGLIVSEVGGFVLTDAGRAAIAGAPHYETKQPSDGGKA